MWVQILPGAPNSGCNIDGLKPTLLRASYALSDRWIGRLGAEVVSDAPLLTSLNHHVRQIRLPRSAANLDAMHSRLENERRDRRCRAVVLAINVELAARRYRDDEPRGAPRLRLRDFRPRLWCPRRLLRRRSAGCCGLLRLAGRQALSFCRRAGFRHERFRRQRVRRGCDAQ